MNIDVNRAFCIFPWIHSYINPRYERSLCCFSKPILECEKYTLNEWWNSKQLKKIRVDMLNGVKNQYCDMCYNDENNYTFSLREQSFQDINEENIQRLIKNTKRDGTLNTLPSFFIGGSILCNLQCLSCGPYFSSRNKSLYLKMFPHNTEKNNFKIDLEFEKRICEEVKSCLVKKSIETIYWQGGEPFLSNETFEIWDEIHRLYQLPEYRSYIENLKMIYNTNMTVLYHNDRFIPDILKLLPTRILASLDGTDETIEYTRDGVSWKEIKFNWNQYYKTLHYRQKMGIGPVLTSPVIMDIDRLLDFFEPYDIDIVFHRYNCHLGQYPKAAHGFLDVRLFPKHIFDRIIDHALNRISNSTATSIERGIAALECYKKEKIENSDFFNNIDMLKEIKLITQERDKYLHTKRPYHELLKIIDYEAYEWYINL